MAEYDSKLLLVEDEALILYSVGDELRRIGFTVLEASNADEALKLLTAHPDIEVVFTDVDMPGSMNGISLAHVVHQNWPAIGVVITSGKVKLAEAAMDEGGVFISKPYGIDRVVDAVRVVTRDSK